MLSLPQGCRGWYLVAVGAAGAAGVAVAGPAAAAAAHVPVLARALVAVIPHHVGQAGASPRLIVAGHVLLRSQHVAGASWNREGFVILKMGAESQPGFPQSHVQRSAL